MCHPELIHIAACADVDAERAAKFAAEYKADTSYGDYRAMLEREKVDLLIIATWPHQHEGHVLAAVEADVPAILCEKSMTTTGASAARMALAARQAGILLVEGFQWRHHPRTLKVQELFRSGRIGKLLAVRAGFNFLVEGANNWRLKVECGGGVVFDQTCYTVNTLGAFIPDVPERVSAHWVRRPDGLIQALYATLTYPGGVIGQIESSQLAPYNEPVEIHGETGILTLNHIYTSTDATYVEVVTGQEWNGSLKREQVEVGAANPWECHIVYLCHCLHTGEQPRFRIEESVRNVSVIEAMLKSAETGVYVTPAVPAGF
jgi:predicted dehydrogenase